MIDWSGNNSLYWNGFHYKIYRYGVYAQYKCRNSGPKDSTSIVVCVPQDQLCIVVNGLEDKLCFVVRGTGDQLGVMEQLARLVRLMPPLAVHFQRVAGRTHFLTQCARESPCAHVLGLYVNPKAVLPPRGVLTVCAEKQPLGVPVHLGAHHCIHVLWNRV